MEFHAGAATAIPQVRARDNLVTLITYMPTTPGGGCRGISVMLICGSETGYKWSRRGTLVIVFNGVCLRLC